MAQTSYGSMTITDVTDVGVTETRTEYYLQQEGQPAPQNPSSSSPGTQGTESIPNYIEGGTYWKRTLTYLTNNSYKAGNWMREDTLTQEIKNTIDALAQAGAAEQRTSKIINNSSGVIVASTISGVNFDKDNPSTYGYNSIMTTNYLGLRYNAIDLMKLRTFAPGTTSPAIELYMPNATSIDGTTVVTQGNKGISINNNAIVFYDATDSTNQRTTLQIGANGFLKSGNYAISSGATYSTTGSYIDLTNGDIITPGFRVKSKEGGADVYVKGHIEAQSGQIGNWYISNGALCTNGYTFGNGIIISPSYTANNENWTIVAGSNFKVTTGGKVYASGAEIEGQITATSGYLGSSTNGFYIDANGIYSGTRAGTSNGDLTLSKTPYSATINGTPKDNWKFNIGSNFGVDAEGNLYGNGANLTNINVGTITIGDVDGLQSVLNGKAGTDAYNYANGYITNIDSYNGITIKAWNGNTHGETDSYTPDTSTNYIKLNTAGLEIVQGGTSIAQYGASARIGAENDSHVLIKSTGININYKTEDGVEPVAILNDTITLGNNNSAHLLLGNNSFEATDNDNAMPYFRVDSNGGSGSITITRTLYNGPAITYPRIMYISPKNMVGLTLRVSLSSHGSTSTAEKVITLNTSRTQILTINNKSVLIYQDGLITFYQASTYDTEKVTAIITTIGDGPSFVYGIRDEDATNAVSNEYKYGAYSMAVGDHVLPCAFGLAVGRYNVRSSIWQTDPARNYYFCVGGGTPDSRANLLGVTGNGNLRIKGDIYVNCNDDSTGGTKLTNSGGGSYTLPIASSTALGGIKVGDSLSIDGSGVLSVPKKHLTSKNDMGFDLSDSTNNNKFTTVGAISYWNGAYNSTNKSNLQYCIQGEFGSIVTVNKTTGSSKFLREDGTWIAIDAGSTITYLDGTTDNIQINGNSFSDVSISYTINTGNTLIGVIGTKIQNASTSGSNGGACVVSWAMVTSTSGITVRIRNTGSSTARVQVTARAMLRK